MRELAVQVTVTHPALRLKSENAGAHQGYRLSNQHPIGVVGTGRQRAIKHPRCIKIILIEKISLNDPHCSKVGANAPMGSPMFGA